MSARPKAKAKIKKATRRTPTTKLLVAMTGKASAAKAAEGDKPVFAYAFIPALVTFVMMMLHLVLRGRQPRPASIG
jgi:hypothetical protein